MATADMTVKRLLKLHKAQARSGKIPVNQIWEEIVAAVQQFSAAHWAIGAQLVRRTFSLFRWRVVPAFTIRRKPLEPELLECRQLTFHVMSQLGTWRERVQDLKGERAFPELVPVSLQLLIAVSPHLQVRTMAIQYRREVEA
jgi:hypothetical protein